MEVSAPPGTILGTVEQEWSIFCPSFAVKNASGDTVLRIEGPFCTMSICGDVEFKVMSGDGAVQVGKISKQWSGLLREMFTDTDYFGITFPMDLDVRMKAVMLGACFLIVSSYLRVFLFFFYMYRVEQIVALDIISPTCPRNAQEVVKVSKPCSISVGLKHFYKTFFDFASFFIC